MMFWVIEELDQPVQQVQDSVPSTTLPGLGMRRSPSRRFCGRFLQTSQGAVERHGAHVIAIASGHRIFWTGTATR